jgi:hypothetical protein
MGLHGLGEVNANAQCSGTEQVGGAVTRLPPLHACSVHECRGRVGAKLGHPTAYSQCAWGAPSSRQNRYVEVSVYVRACP